MTSVRVHTLIGFANPFFICDTCKERVKYWHNPDRCGCDEGKYYNHPCEHAAGISSICADWNPVDGCMCENKETHDR